MPRILKVRGVFIRSRPMRYSAIIPAGGTSSRFGHGNKLFRMLNGKPVFLYAVELFLSFTGEKFLVIPVHKNEMNRMKELLAQYLPGSRLNVVPGGTDRTHSVLNALEAMPDGADLTAVHDAARPLIRRETIRAVYHAAELHSAAAAAGKITNTIKLCDENGLLTAGGLDREMMREIETPQIFRTNLLRTATGRAVEEGLSFTDDTAAVEYFCGIRAFPVQPEEINLKITKYSDLALAEALLKLR